VNQGYSRIGGGSATEKKKIISYKLQYNLSIFSTIIKVREGDIYNFIFLL